MVFKSIKKAIKRSLVPNYFKNKQEFKVIICKIIDDVRKFISNILLRYQYWIYYINRINKINCFYFYQ